MARKKAKAGPFITLNFKTWLNSLTVLVQVIKDHRRGFEGPRVKLLLLIILVPTTFTLLVLMLNSDRWIISCFFFSTVVLAITKM